MENEFDSKEFLVELCRYYMEFLETDFKEKRAPARRITFWSKDNLLTDISLNKYPQLNNAALTLLLSSFRENPFAAIDRDDFGVRLNREVIEKIKECRRDNGTFNISRVEKCLREFLESHSVADSDRVVKEIRDYLQNNPNDDFVSYLSPYSIARFHDEVYDLWKNKQVLDRQDFYLYFQTSRIRG